MELSDSDSGNPKKPVCIEGRGSGNRRALSYFGQQLQPLTSLAARRYFNRRRIEFLGSNEFLPKIVMPLDTLRRSS
jgi:hypothetical protein